MMTFLFLSFFPSFFCLCWSSLSTFLFFFLFFFIFKFPLYYDEFIPAGFLDSVSYFLIYLTIWVCYLMLSSSNSVYKFNFSKSLFSAMIILLFLSLWGVFVVDSILMFYFFFEFSLVPTALLIMGWGYQVERFQAFMYFIMYTMFSSLPLLVFILFIKKSLLVVSFHEFYYWSFNSGGTFFWGTLLIFWCIFGAFLVKLPMYFFHLWLPKAHVEAPVSGSMILAGVLLKMGGYGFIRLSFMFSCLISSVSIVFISLGVWSMVFIGLNCLRSNDMKSLIAYSSVSHMGACMVGLFTLYLWGWLGGLYMLIGHGLCSSGLFSYINLLYERTSSRSLLINKSLLMNLKSLVVMSFLLSIINMAAPPSMNLFSEVYLMYSLLSYDSYLMGFMLFGSFLVACYSIYFFYTTQMGKSHSSIFSISSLTLNEYHNLSLHVTPLLISFMFLFML